MSYFVLGFQDIEETKLFCIHKRPGYRSWWTDDPRSSYRT